MRTENICRLTPAATCFRRFATAEDEGNDKDASPRLSPVAALWRESFGREVVGVPWFLLYSQNASNQAVSQRNLSDLAVGQSWTPTG